MASITVYARELFKALHFYLKPGIKFHDYPKYDDPDKDKYVRIWERCMPRVRKGIRKVWKTYNVTVKQGDINKLKLLLADVESMITTVQSGGKFHASMTKTEEIISLKKLAMSIYNQIGLLNECTRNYDKALECYDQGTKLFDLPRNSPNRSLLVECRDNIYRNIQTCLTRRDKSSVIDALILNVGWAQPILPWALLVLGTKLAKEGKKVRLLDGYSREPEILRCASDANLIGFSVMTAQIGASLKLSRQIKKLHPDKSVVWGGIHPTLFPEQCLAEETIDFVVVGDGEDALTELVTRHQNKQSNFDDITGLGFKKNGRAIVNPIGKPARFEEAGPWKFELLNMQNYMNWSMMHIDFRHPSLSLLATRGCPKGCAFCVNSVLKHTRIHRARPVESVIDEIEELIKKFHVRTINFPDEAFFLKPEYFASFIEEIRRRDLDFKWGADAHIADVLKHKKLILEAKKAGLIWTGGSGESGSNRLLKLLRKGITVEDILECMHFLADNGLMTASCFMTYIPTETPEETRATLNLMDRIKGIFKEKNNPSYIMGPSVFRPYPGSKLYEMCVESGFRQPETLEDWGKMILPAGNFKHHNITWYGGKA